MKKRWITLAGMISLAAAVTAAFPAFSAGWTEEPAGWRYEYEDGRTAAGGWHWLDRNGDGREECYYFDERGILAVSSVTPDGYSVGADGAWEEDGRAVTRDAGQESSSEAGSGEISAEVREVSRSGVKDVLIRRAGNIEAGGDYFRVLNDPLHGNEGLMRNSHSEGNPGENDWETLTRQLIPVFLEKYRIMAYSDPFEKELAIIAGLVKECRYRIPDNTEDLSYYTAYSCLAGHYAQCAGYADAFLQIVRTAMPEADVRYVHSDTHAWNLIQLGDGWYHVDVTWEDDDGSGEVLNRFINLEDSDAESVPYHRWDREDSGEPPVTEARGTAYGPLSVDYYLQKGIVERTPATAEFTARDSVEKEGIQEIRDFIFRSAKQSLDSGGHLAAAAVYGPRGEDGKMILREIMREMPHLLGRTIRYSLSAKYRYGSAGEAEETGILVLLEME